MILVTGAPRSGTHTACELFQGLGLRIGHERWDADGICAYWYYRHWPEVWDEGPRMPCIRAEAGFTKAILLLRHPLGAINSMADICGRGKRLSQLFDVAEERDALTDAARIWLTINRDAEVDAWAFIETLATTRRANAFDRRPITLADLSRRDPETAWQVFELGWAFGYKDGWDERSRGL